MAALERAENNSGRSPFGVGRAVLLLPPRSTVPKSPTPPHGSGQRRPCLEVKDDQGWVIGRLCSFAHAVPRRN